MATIKRSGVDVSDLYSPDEYDSISLDERANDGEPGIGTMPIPDALGTTNTYAGQSIEVDVSATQVFFGYQGGNSRDRSIAAAGSRLVNSHAVIDQNARLVGFRSGHVSRPKETDYARMLWFFTTYLPDLDTTWVLNTHTQTAAAKKYHTDSLWQELLDDLKDLTGKTGFVEGGRAHWHLYTEGIATGISLSDVDADWGPDCFGILPGVSFGSDPMELANDVRVENTKGAFALAVDSTSKAQHDVDGLKHQMLVITDDDSTSLASQAATLLSANKDEKLTWECDVGPLTADQVAAMPVGSLITVTSFVMRLSGATERIAERVLTMKHHDRFFLHLFLSWPKRRVLRSPVIPPPEPVPGPGPGGSGGGGGIPPCGITDSFDRPDNPSALGKSDAGRDWATSTGTPAIVANQGQFSGVGGGSALLPGPWPVPFNGSIWLTDATIPLLPAYTEASDWGPSWDKFNPGGLGAASVNGSIAFIDSADPGAPISMRTFVPVVDAVNGGFSVFLSLVPGGSFTGSPDLEWHFDAAGFTFKILVTDSGFDVFTSPGGPSDPTGPSSTHYGPGAWIMIYYQYVLAGAVVPIETSTPMQFDTYAGFTSGGITDVAQCLINAADSAEFDFGGQVATVGTSIWGPPVNLGGTVDAISISGALGSSLAAGYFDTDVTEVVPQISDTGWAWSTTGLAADGTTVLEYTAEYLSTGHAPAGGVGMWDPGTDPPAFDVPTPLIYVDISDGVTHARAWARLPGDLTFPTQVFLDITSNSMTITGGGAQAIAFNADASLPDTGTLNNPLLHTFVSGLGSDLTYNDLDVKGVNRCGTVTPTGPVLAATIPLSIDVTGATDESVDLSNWINSQPPGSKIIFPATGTIQAALKLHGLLNVELDGQGCTIQAPSGGYTEDFSTIYLQSFGGSNQNVTIHDFHLIGTSPTPGTFISGHEGQHGILADGSVNLEVYNIVCEAMFGDFLEVNSGATLTHAHDSTVINTGRNGLSVIHGDSIEFGPGIDLQVMGYMPYDVEPNDASESCFQIEIHHNQSADWSNAYLAVDGSATGAAIHDISVHDNESTGFSLKTLVNPSGTAREQNVTFENNSSDVSEAGPVLSFIDVDGLSVIHNTQALSSGVLVSDATCTDKVDSPNP